MERQSSRMIYHKRDHKDAYWQPEKGDGHYVDYMVLNSDNTPGEIVWRKLFDDKVYFFSPQTFVYTAYKNKYYASLLYPKHKISPAGHDMAYSQMLVGRSACNGVLYGYIESVYNSNFALE